MKSVAEWIYLTDQSIFVRIRAGLGSSFLESNAGIFANLNAWMPLFVFLAIFLYMSRPQSAVYSLFFGLGAFVLSFQAASYLANTFLYPAPWRLEYLMHEIELPAFGHGSEVCLPDWGISAFVGAVHFARLRLRDWNIRGMWWLWGMVLVFMLLRVYAGYSYPVGATMAVFVGLLVGWLVYQLARNLEVLTPPQANDESDVEREE